MDSATVLVPPVPGASPIRGEPLQNQGKKNAWSNLVAGGLMNLTQTSTLGQPFEVLKTHIKAAANRNDSLADGIRKTWARGGLRGFYQGLIPWAWIEASTKGSVLLLTSSEAEYLAHEKIGLGNTLAGAFGGLVGGASQAYLTMGITTSMKTAEITRSKALEAGITTPTTMQVFLTVWRTKGIRGINRGVNAVALRQMTGWASKFGITRFTEGQIKSLRGKAPSEKLSVGETLCASVFAGTISCWNQPFEVVRIEMQSMVASKSGVSSSSSMLSTARLIYNTSGVRGFFKGMAPRVGLSVWATICMIGLGDKIKDVTAVYMGAR